MRPSITISHQSHPARRQGKSLASISSIKYALASAKRLIIFTTNIDNCYDKIKELYPEAKLTKCENCVLVEKKTIISV